MLITKEADLKTLKKIRKQKLAFITGANGFIGRRLVKQLQARDILVTNIDHHALSNPLYLENYLVELAPDYIFHLAAYGNMANQTDEPEVLIANINNLWNLLQASRDSNYSAFINVSTSSVSLDHQTIYSATKMGGEYLCKAFVDEFNKPIVSVRPYSVYGEGEADFRFIPTVFRSCLRGETMNLIKEAVHDWIYIDDVITLILACVDNINTVKGNFINAGTGIGTDNLSVVKIIESLTGKKAKIGKQVKPLRSFDNNNWICPTPYAPALPLQEGLKKCLLYYGLSYTK